MHLSFLNRNLLTRKTGLYVVACIAIVLFASVSPKIIPYNMDELSHYHVLGCQHYPLNKAYNTYREACGMYDLKLPLTDTFLPLRAYSYIGTLQVIPFYPFWLLFDNPVASRVQGAVFFLLTTYLVARWLRIECWKALLVSVLYPPFFLAFILDTGTVGILISLLLGILLLTRWAAQRHGAARIRWLIVAGLLTFLGITIKLVFAWIVPAIGLLLVREIIQNKPAHPKQVLLALASYGLPLAALTAYYFLAVDRSGAPQFLNTFDSTVSLTLTSVLHTAKELSNYVWNGSAFSPRIIRFPFQGVDIIPFLLGLGLVISASVYHKTLRLKVAWFLGLGVITFLMMCLSNRAWAQHHFVFAFVFWIMAVAVSFDAVTTKQKRFIAPLVCLAVIYWLVLALRLPTAYIFPDTNHAKDTLLRSIRTLGLDTRSVQVHESWGTFYIAHVFGDQQQIVLFIDNFSTSTQRIEAVKAIAQKEQRTIVVSTRAKAKLETSPQIKALLGEPIASHMFDNWSLLEYAP